MLHFGEEDASVDPKNISQINHFYPGAIIHNYAQADHGFNCDHRANFDEKSAQIARERTMDFFKTHLG